jgi:hypothetical protein
MFDDKFDRLYQQVDEAKGKIREISTYKVSYGSMLTKTKKMFANSERMV